MEEWVDRLLALATSSSRDLGRTAADSWWILLGRDFRRLLANQIQPHSLSCAETSVENPIKAIHQIYPKRHWPP